MLSSGKKCDTFLDIKGNLLQKDNFKISIDDILFRQRMQNDLYEMIVLKWWSYDTLMKCALVFIAKNIRHLPIVDEENNFVSMKSIKDVFRNLAEWI